MSLRESGSLCPVNLDPATLLGFAELAAADDEPALRAALDAAHNKIGAEPDDGPAARTGHPPPPPRPRPRRRSRS